MPVFTSLNLDFLKVLSNIISIVSFAVGNSLRGLRSKISLASLEVND